MKTCATIVWPIVLLGLCFLTLFSGCGAIEATITPDTPKVTWDKASEFTGERVTVMGPCVFGTANSDRPMSLVLGVVGPRYCPEATISRPGNFLIIVAPEAIERFPSNLAKRYVGKNIAVRGTITIGTGGNPQVTLTDPSQLYIVR